MPVKRLVNVDRAMLGDAAHRHAGMLRLDHHRNAAGLEDLVDRGGDLGGEMLLGLQAAGEDSVSRASFDSPTTRSTGV